MTSDEDHGVHGEHVVEIPNEFRDPRSARRRSFATISMAVCLAAAGTVTAFALLRDQAETASEKERDAARREQLIDGWTTLGAVAAQHAQDEMRAPATPAPATSVAAPPAAAPAPVQNVIVVGSQAQTAQPLPTAGGTSSNTAASPPVTVISPASPTVTSPASARTVPAPRMTTPVGVPAKASAPNQTPLTPAPGSPDTVLSPVTYPASQSCGLTTCNVDSVCCNVSCGICTAPGEGCTQNQCG